MSLAQESEIEQLHRLLASVSAERDTAVANAEQLHLALFSVPTSDVINSPGFNFSVFEMKDGFKSTESY